MRPIPNRAGAIPDHTSPRATQAGRTNRRPSLADHSRRPSPAGHNRRAIQDHRSLRHHASRRGVRSHIES